MQVEIQAGASEYKEQGECRAFSFSLPNYYGSDANGVKIRVSRIVPQDLDQAGCADVAAKACHLACMAVDVMRGRLNANLLDNFVCEQGIERLLFMGELLNYEGSDLIRGNLPVIPLFLYGTVIDTDHFDACIGISIGTEKYRVSMVLERQGSRWTSTFLDFG